MSGALSGLLIPPSFLFLLGVGDHGIVWGCEYCSLASSSQLGGDSLPAEVEGTVAVGGTGEMPRAVLLGREKGVPVWGPPSKIHQQREVTRGLSLPDVGHPHP